MKIARHSSLGLTLCFAQFVCVNGVFTPECPQEVWENSSDIVVTCTDIGPEEQVVWQYKPAGGPVSDVGTCNPPPEGCIIKLSNLMSVSRPSGTTSTVIIKNVSRTLFEEAIFTCSVFHLSSLTGSASCRIKVVYPPEIVSFTADNEHTGVTINESEGDAVALNCIAKGYPTPQLTLLQNGNLLRQLTPVQITDKTSTELQYFVPAVCNNIGRIACVANNTAGDDEEGVFLHIQCAPRQMSWDTETILTLRADINITIGVFANPSPTTLKFECLKNGTRVNTTDAPEPNSFLRANCKSKAVKPQHICTISMLNDVPGDIKGEYAIDIVNTIGRLRITFHVNGNSDIDPDTTPMACFSLGELIGSTCGGMVFVIIVVIIVLIFYKRHQPDGEPNLYIGNPSTSYNGMSDGSDGSITPSMANGATSQLPTGTRNSSVTLPKERAGYNPNVAEATEEGYAELNANSVTSNA